VSRIAAADSGARIPLIRICARESAARSAPKIARGVSLGPQVGNF
jgi:hypothetical protein